MTLEPADLRAMAAFVARFDACTLPKSEWTHEAHFIVGLWYVAHHPAPEALDLLRERIRRYNEATGTANTDSGGYHETLTRFYVTVIAHHLAQLPGQPLPQVLAALLSSPWVDKAAALRFYSRDLLFSVEARRDGVAPDLAPLP